jgi:hypothetical protein
MRTSNMGALYRLCYLVTLKKDTSSKALIDDIRTRNGNLEVALGRDIFKVRNNEL